MTRDQLLAELREVLAETHIDGAWSEATLLGYLSEGQDKFCEETGFFIDFTTHSLTTATDINGNYLSVYAIPDRIIRVLDIWDGTRKLGKFQQEDRAPWPIVGTPSVFSTTGSDVYAWQADQATGSITLYPTPTSVKTYQLRVWRYPRYDLAGDDVNGDPAQPEIPSRFQRAAVEWAAYKALMHHDMEQQDPVKAADHLAAFRMYVSDGKKALRRFQSEDTVIRGNYLYVV